MSLRGGCGLGCTLHTASMKCAELHRFLALHTDRMLGKLNTLRERRWDLGQVLCLVLVGEVCGWCSKGP